MRNYTLKIFHGQKEERVETKSIVRFLRRVRLINWSESNLRVYIRVSYGKQKDNYGKLTTFYNNGDFTNRQDFELALNAFLEK